MNKTPVSFKIEGKDDNLNEDVDKHDGLFLSTPEKRRLFTEGELADHKTPEGDTRTFEPTSNDNTHKFDTVPEKRRRFRRPSFSRPSFGFFTKRSTPDLRKLANTPSKTGNSSGKRTRSNSANENDDKDVKRRFSFTPFLERKFNQQRNANERRSTKRSNKVSTSSKIENNGSYEFKDSNDMEMFKCSKTLADNVNKVEIKPNRARPEVRAPLMKIQSNGKALLPSSLNIRRETLALHKEQKNDIDAFRPRRETLAIHRDNQPKIVPFKPRKEYFDYEKGQPILESFKPKRDSLLIHKKCQPQLEHMKRVAKDVYDDLEYNSSCHKIGGRKEIQNEKENIDEMRKVSVDRKIRLIDTDVKSPVKFTTFGKKNIELNEKLNSLEESKSDVRRMSTGSIGRIDWTKLRTFVSICFVYGKLII